MSINPLVAVAIAVTSVGIIAGACKHHGAQGKLETSATPNNSVLNNNTAAGVGPEAKFSRNLGTVLAAY